MKVIFEEGRAPIKAWVDGVELDPKAEQQLLNLAAMPFIYKHVAVMPDVHHGIGATVGSVIATSGAVIPAAVGVDIGCFAGETKVPLLDGTQKTLIELSQNKESFWIYSINKEQRIVPGKAKCIKTRSNAKLMKIVISGGEEIVCTPDHEFMLSDGSYKEASSLRMHDSLMPLYRKWTKGGGYESCSNGYKKSRFTPKMVYEAIYGEIPKGHVIHHKNVKQWDNRPENLQAMTPEAHSALHRAMGKSWNNSDPSFQVARLAGIKRRSMDPTKKAQMAEVGTKNIKDFMQNRRDEFLESIKDNGVRGAEYLKKFNTSPKKCSDCGELLKNPSALRWHKKNEHQYNHTVLWVEQLDRQDDVYCLQVEEYHNFALAAGVFVHNCGMMVVRTSLKAADLPENLLGVRTAIEAAVPHGRTDNGGKNDKGRHQDVFPEVAQHALAGLWEDLMTLKAKHPVLETAAGGCIGHMGTLGTGNHFIEVCLDKEDNVWLMLHSGSRGIGNKIGMYFIEKAKKDMEKWFINLPDKDLAYIPDGSETFKDYLEAVDWAQRFATNNRETMMKLVIAAVRKELGIDFGAEVEVINCHHNYVNREAHFGKNVLVTRKGAVRARLGDMGIIPGSMGARSYIVRGKGNKESFCSCSHGAGRRLSRTEAGKRFTLEDHALATAGVECRKDNGVLDETPGAYKDIDAVMAAQKDLVDIVTTLKQIVCIKG